MGSGTKFCCVPSKKWTWLKLHVTKTRKIILMSQRCEQDKPHLKDVNKVIFMSERQEQDYSHVSKMRERYSSCLTDVKKVISIHHTSPKLSIHTPHLFTCLSTGSHFSLYIHIYPYIFTSPHNHISTINSATLYIHTSTHLSLLLPTYTYFTL